MRTLALTAFTALIALPFAAAAEIYTWKDASGKTVYSDKPPLEKKVPSRELRSGKTGSTEAPAAPKAAEAPAAKTEPGGDSAAPDKSPDQVKAEAEARQSLCDNARKRLIQLESSSGIIITKDAKGNEVPLVGESRKAETETARKDVQQWCK